MRTSTAIQLALAGYGMAQNATTYACNPAHSYPNGATCVETAGSLTLVTPAPSATTYACNPAHSYPNGATCIETAGSLTLVTPAASSTATVDCQTQYDQCRVAPEANMAACASQYAGCLGYNPFAPNGTDSYTTEVVTAYTTYCPHPTTVVPGNGKTYTVTSATTLTITDCPCTVKKPISSSTLIPPPPANTTVPPNTSVPVPTTHANSTTSVVTAVTTYCPTPTTLTIGTSLTYTVSSATTITATCPGGCTITVPVSSAPPGPSVPAGNNTIPGSPSGTGFVPSATIPVFEGAGSKFVASSSLLGLICIVVAML